MDLSKYYTEICKEPILSKAEEEKLLSRYIEEDIPETEKEAIKNRVIKANLRFAFKQAKTYSRNDPSIFPDLISAANEGLLVGLSKYNPGRGVRFLSYAGWWVVQRILDEMSNMRIVSLPKWKQQLSTRIVKAIENDEKITLAELKVQFADKGVAAKDIEELYNTRYLTYYIDDLEESNFEIDPISQGVEKALDNEKVWKEVSSLPSPHREILAKSFGFEDEIEVSPAKLAKLLKMPKEDVLNYKREGLEMLKNKLNTASKY